MDYIEINRNAWNIKTDIHFDSDFYNNNAFLKGKSSLKGIESELLCDVKGKNILHLQCHFGQDSISLARMGANVTAIDLSDKAIGKAKILSEKTKTDVEFICCNIYDLPEHLNKQFDIVFTSYGVISWLPDLKKWADIISLFLKPEGCFIFVEFHPFLWMYDGEFSKIEYTYHNTEAIVEDVKGSYADRNADAEYKTVLWNHSLSEVLNSLINSGIQIISFDEYNFSPFDCFLNSMQIGEDKFIIKHLGGKIPMTYSIKGLKRPI